MHKFKTKERKELESKIMKTVEEHLGMFGEGVLKNHKLFIEKIEKIIVKHREDFMDDLIELNKKAEHLGKEINERT